MRVRDRWPYVRTYVRACDARVRRVRRGAARVGRVGISVLCVRSSIGLRHLSSFELRNFRVACYLLFCVPLFSACTMHATTTRSASLPSRASSQAVRVPSPERSVATSHQPSLWGGEATERKGLVNNNNN